MVQVIEFFRHTYPNTMTFVREVDEWRAYLGRFGISGRLQVRVLPVHCCHHTPGSLLAFIAQLQSAQLQLLTVRALYGMHPCSGRSCAQS